MGSSVAVEDSLFSTRQRVLILGSSVSIQKDGYLPLLQQKLDGLCNQDHEYLNASLGGTPSEATYCYVHANLAGNIADFNPTVCIIEKTPNDRLYHYHHISDSQVSASLSRAEKFLSSLVRHFLSRNCIVILLSMYVQPTSISGSGVIDHLSYLIPLYDRVSSANSIPHVNIAAEVLARVELNNLSRYFLDDVHLSEDGATLVASIVLESLSRMKSHDCIGLSDARSSKPESDCVLDLMALISGKENNFSNSLLSFRYDIIDRGEELIVNSLSPGSLVGLFYLNDATSGWVQLTTDCGGTYELCLFDHYSFMPRLHYLTLPDACFVSTIALRVVDRPIDYKVSINAYRTAKTFDPDADWALKKWYEPLVDAMNHPEKTSFKPVMLLASRSL